MTCCKHLVHKESALKTSSYFVVHIAIAFFVSWFVSGSLAIALGISMIEPAIQMIGYYFHERIWNKTPKVPEHLSQEEIQKEIERTGAPTREQEIHMGTLEEYKVWLGFFRGYDYKLKRNMVKTIQQPWAKEKLKSWGMLK